MLCSVDLEVGQKQILIRTGSGDFRFEVWEGGIDREVWDLLKSLEHPHLRDNLIRRWEINMPEPMTEANPNTGAERRFIVLSSHDRARIVLRCTAGAFPIPVSQPLYRMFKQLDWRKEQAHEEDRHRHDAQAQRGALEGGSGGHRPDPGAGMDGPAQEGQVAAPAGNAEDPELRRAIGRNPLMRTPLQEQYLEKLRAARAAKPASGLRRDGHVGRPRRKRS